MKLRMVLLGTVVALAPGLALAADLPSRHVLPVMAATPFSWTGVYVGVNAGYGMLSSKKNHSGLGSGSGSGSGVGSGSIAGRQHDSGGGVLGGAQIGYNQQFGALVFGLEADIAASSMKSSSLTTASAFSVGSGSGSGGGGGSTTLSSSSRMSGFGTLRGRIGYSIDRALFYVTGGLAYAKVRNTMTFAVDTPFWASSVTASQDKWKTGWTVGAGMEYALNNNWSVKAEALYFDLGKTSFTVASSDINGTIAMAGSIKNTGYLGRMGVNYRF